MDGRDERGVAPVIGFILVFSFLVLAFTIYQGMIVPDQNRAAEIQHNQRVQGQMQEIRNAILSAATGGSGRAVTVTLGADYPRRTLAGNLGYSAGRLETTTYPEGGFISIANATVLDRDGETADYWNGSTKRFRTESIVYHPIYSFYTDAPETVYANTLVYNRFPAANVSIVDQALIEGKRITLVSLVGNISKGGSGTVSIDPEALSVSTNTIAVRNETGPITVTIPTRLDVSWWRDVLSQEIRNGHVRSVTRTGKTRVSIRLESGVTYTLQLAKIGVGSGGENPPPAYLTLVDRPSPTVFPDTTHSIVVEVRDTFDNPVTGVAINASVGSGGGSFAKPTVRSGSNGRARFVYHAPFTGGPVTLRFSIRSNASTADEVVTVNLTVSDPVMAGPNSSDGGGSYKLQWRDPTRSATETAEDFGRCDATDCVWYADHSGDRLPLRSVTTPALAGVTVDFALDNTTIGSLDPGEGTTGSDGRATTYLTATHNGSVSIYVTSDSGTDRIDITIQIPGRSDETPRIGFRLGDLTHPSRDAVEYVGSFDISNTNASFRRVEIAYRNTNNGAASKTISSGTTRGSLVYTSNYGAGDSYEVTIEVIYEGESGEYVVTSRTVTDVADASNPATNDDLSNSQSAALTSSTITDSTTQSGPRYRIDYEVGSGSFGKVRVVAVSRNGGGKVSRTLRRRSAENVVLSPDYGRNQEFKLVVLVFDAEGAVVDARIVTDVADGADP